MSAVAKASELYRRSSLKLGNNEIDPDAANLIYGRLPLISKGVDRGKRPIAVVGAGDVYDKFQGPVLRHRGTKCVIYDAGIAKNWAASEARRTQIHSENASIVKTEEEMWEANPRLLLVSTPPDSHLYYIQKGLVKMPVAVEKPLVRSAKELAELNQIVQDSELPLFCIDWQVHHATPLMYACNLAPPFADAIVGDPSESFYNFNFQNVNQIIASNVQGENNAASHSYQTSTGRKWLDDYQYGGGVLFDMMVHQLAVLAVMGFIPARIVDAAIGKLMLEHVPGCYERIGNQLTGEMYGQASMMFNDSGGREIPAFIQAGKRGAPEDRHITLFDGQGNRLYWEVSKLRNEVILQDAEGDTLARAGMNVDPYALTFQHIDEWLTAPESTCVYYPEQALVTSTILEMHGHARSRVPSSEPLLQRNGYGVPFLANI